MGKSVEFLYILAGTYEQYRFYIYDSQIGVQGTKYISTVHDLRGVRFNEETVRRAEPRGWFRRKLGLQPKFKEVPAERVNRLVVVGLWRHRPDIRALRFELEQCGARPPE